MRLRTQAKRPKLPSGSVRLITTLVLALGVALLATACGSSGAKKVDGLRAGGLDAGAKNGAKFGIRRGKFMELGFIGVTNKGKTTAVIESATPIASSNRVEVTRARVWVIPPGTKNLLPYLDVGWPPADAPLVGKLPSKNVAMPVGKQAQLVFGVRSLAPVGTTVRITGVRVLFKQGGQRYDWTLPLSVEMLTTKVSAGGK